MSSDDLRINIWNIGEKNTVYNVLEFKPKSITEIEEALTSAEFHPKVSSLFLYTTSKGCINICDLRSKASF